MTISSDSRWFIFRDDHLLLTIQESGKYDIPTHAVTALDSHLIGNTNQENCYCAELPTDFILTADTTLAPLRTVLNEMDSKWFAPIIKGYQIMQWNKNHVYCGRCGNKTIDKTTATTFERHCTQCNISFYPKISPSIIVRIQKDNQILMARSPHFKPGVYGLIAGFIDPGETAEEAVHREVREEVGIEIKNVRYVGSQPWPFPDALILAFTADYAGGEIQIDNIEIEAANWYRADNLPGLPSHRISIARQLIDDFIALH